MNDGESYVGMALNKMAAQRDVLASIIILYNDDSGEVLSGSNHLHTWLAILAQNIVTKIANWQVGERNFVNNFSSMSSARLIIICN